MTDSRSSDNLHLVVKRVNKIGHAPSTMPPVIRIKGNRKAERIAAANNFKLVHDVNLKSSRLTWEQIAQLDRHCFFFILALGNDSCITSSDGVFVPLLRLFFLDYLALYDFIVNSGLKIRK